MIEDSHKIYFSPLPFSPQLSYLEIKPNHNQLIQNDLYDYELENNVKSMPNSNLSSKKRNFIKLNEQALNFQYSFYQIFTSRKRFPKKYVALIHNSVCHDLNLRRINRDEIRSIFLYFDNFANSAEKILIFIKNNKEEIIKKLPELKVILK